MDKPNYKYLSIALGVIALIFAVLYFNKPEPSVGDVYQNVSDRVSDCSKRVASWNEKYGNQASSTDKQNALDDILEDCQEDIKGSGEDLSEN